MGLKKKPSGLCLHPFGNHIECSKVWCHHKRNPTTSKYFSFLYGQPLKIEVLQQDLETIFNKQKQHSSILANLGSTESNEIFKKPVAFKAPKSILLSRSITYRLVLVLSRRTKGKATYLIQVLMHLNRYYKYILSCVGFFFQNFIY